MGGRYILAADTAIPKYSVRTGGCGGVGDNASKNVKNGICMTRINLYSRQNLYINKI